MEKRLLWPTAFRVLVGTCHFSGSGRDNHFMEIIRYINIRITIHIQVCNGDAQAVTQAAIDDPASLVTSVKNGCLEEIPFLINSFRYSLSPDKLSDV